MKKKSEKRRTARTLFIGAIAALFAAVMVLTFAYRMEEKASHREREDKEKFDRTINTICTFLFIDAGVELIAAIIVSVMASQEENTQNIIDAMQQNQLNVSKAQQYNSSSSDTMSYNTPVPVVASQIVPVKEVSNSVINESREHREPQRGFWMCPKCYRENADYVGSCACGEKKPASPKTYEQIKHAHNASYTLKFCPSCGAKITEQGQTFCGSCGYKLN
ncbi:MAG: zinc ribbon domain-containing protein [Ruminococcus sp.]|nr:zinc ribbon domain-containing protein [Ruminococcus sp.]